MKGRIKRISEAFSMQPNGCSVCDLKGLHEHGSSCIKEIKYTIHNLVVDNVQKQYDFLTAVNFQEESVFDFVATAMNIEYFTE